jgi:hypothetical protein
MPNPHIHSSPISNYNWHAKIMNTKTASVLFLFVAYYPSCWEGYEASKISCQVGALPQEKAGWQGLEICLGVAQAHGHQQMQCRTHQAPASSNMTPSPNNHSMV